MDPKRPKQSLNADAITEILLRLPAKSICRFRCVSKPWLSLLSDPRFLRAHSASALSAPSGFYVYDPHHRQAEFFPLSGGGGGHPDPTLSFLDYEGSPPEAVDACNGLLLCRLPKHFHQSSDLSVCNPTTREHEVIPSPPEIHREIRSDSLRLAFDPRRSPHYMIIWLDHQRMYKYSSQTRSWKLLEAESDRPLDMSPSVYWNGSFVWSVHHLNKLAALDVEGEQLRGILLPPRRRWTDKFLHLAVSGHRLHYIRGQSRIRLEILEMTSELSGWHVLHRVDLVSIKQLIGYGCKRVKEFIRGDEDRLLIHMPHNLVSYHIQQKIFTTICPPSNYSYKIFPLAHSLFPLNVNMIDAPPSKKWVSWNSEHDQLLINMMVEHSRNGKKIKNGFRIVAWREMVRMFNQVTGLNYNVRHLENRLKSYKREYQTVKKILSIDGFHWAPSDKAVNANDADWHKILKSKPRALLYKRKQVRFDDLEIICASFCGVDNKVLQTLAVVN